MTAKYATDEAQQNFASLLDRAATEGEARVKRRDGQVFVIKPERIVSSPLDVDCLDLDISVDEILEFIAEGRRYS